MRTLKLISLGVVLVTCLFAVVPAQAIENVRGKSYELRTAHGPWMVMVTSFRNVPKNERRTEGMTAEEAAAELVFELREKGIPAYTFSQDAAKGEIETRDRLGRDDHRIYAAQRDMICVLAGNYEKVDDNTAKKTLEYIQSVFSPKFLKNPKSGAIMRNDAPSARPDGRKRGPLSGAFLTINPMLKPEDVVKKNVDRETKFLNSNLQFALVDNPHKYSIRVASFSGKSATPLGNSSYRGKSDQFDEDIKKSAKNNSSGYNIVRAGEDAEQLVAYIRASKFDPQKRQFAEAGVFDAFVYHDKFQSVVTIGGFDSPDDPRIRTIAQYYGPKMVPDFRFLRASNKNSMPTQEDFERLPQILTTHTEQLFAQGADPRTASPVQIWTFDPEPQVIPIPRIK